MERLVQNNSWYGWGDLSRNWAALDFSGFIKSSIGDIKLNPQFGNPLYLVGATYTATGKFLMGGQSQNGFGTIFYTDGEWFQLDPRSFGVSTCAFSQDGRYFYGVVDATTAIVRDNETGVLSFINLNFFTDGIRGVRQDGTILLGNTSNYSPKYDLHQFIELAPDELCVGQGADGLVVWFNGLRYLVEPGGTFFIRAMYDGFNLALATVKQTELAEVNWFLNIDELQTFPIAGQEPVEVIGRRMYNGWIEHSEPPMNLVPTYANCLMRVHEAGAIRLVSDGVKIYQWVQGHTVEEIEQQCQANPNPCFAYWDARTWPKMPKLKSNDVLGLQMYCLKEETPHIFEMNQQAVIDSIPAEYNLGGVNQCFTSNDGLTKNIKGLVPVYSRLYKKNTRLKFSLGFCDTRPTGLQDHPEVLPLWQQFHAGIIGVPGMSDNGVVDGKLVNPQTYHFSIVEGMQLDGTEETLRKHLEVLKPQWYKFGFGIQHNSDCASRPRNYFPTAICPNAAPNPANPNEVCLGVKQDPQCWEGQGRFANLTNHPPTEWIWDEHGGPAYQPIGTVPEPPPNDMSILVFGFTNPTRRSDPLGCHIQLEVGSERPIKRLTITMPGSGMEEKVIEFPIIPGNDGRFWRGFNVKLTHEGTWPLQLTAADDIGNTVTVEAGRVTVIP